MMQNLHQYLDLTQVREISLEANPSSLDQNRMETYARWKVNRISIGIQSFHKENLSALGRIHNPDQALDSISMAHSFNFAVSIDLMFGIPGQKTESLIRDVRTAVQLPLSHLSLYGLTIERKTRFYQWKKKGVLPRIEEESYDEMYLQAAGMLEESGLKRYEVSSFASPQKECLHNRNYWNHSEYLGIGPGAHSLLKGRRIANSRKFAEYERWVLQNSPVNENNSELLSRDTLYEESVWLGLRSVQGIDLKNLSSKFCRHPSMQKLNSWIERGYMERYKKDTYRLKDKGWIYLDGLTADLLSHSTSVAEPG
jgi:oxygen-independent coproporphyrinogen-3 oxidase